MNPIDWLSGGMLLGQATPTEVVVVNSPAWNFGFEHIVRGLLAATVFSLVGVCVLAAAIWVIVRIVPFSVIKEIEEDQNTALGIIMGSIILGISIIIAASVMG